MDEADQAQWYQEALNADALARRAQNGRANNDPPIMIMGRPHCRDCRAAIPPGRLAAMPQASRCVGCQAWLDKQSALIRSRM